MSVLSSKHIAINIVELPDQTPSAVDKGTDARMQILEQMVSELLEWKRGGASKPASGTRALPAAAGLARSSDDSSSQSDDFSDGGSASSVSSPETKPVKSHPVKLGPDLLQPLDQSAAANLARGDVTSRIMTILQRYGQNEENETGEAWLGRFRFEPRVRKAVDAGITIPLVLPAFPWKSVNKPEKVLGTLPDLGEVLGLGRLNQVCEDIREIYPPGAKVTITSDGLVYNDLLGISDEEVYYYGAALRRLPEEMGYTNLEFIRIMNLLGMSENLNMTREEYLDTVGRVRETLVEKYLDPSFDTPQAILEDQDINLTYRGYLKFLAKDLKHSPITEGIEGKNEYKRVVKRVAQDMITRGKAFATAIEVLMPDFVRLSIHRSTGLLKLSFPLVPQPNHFSMTPWHCSIAVTHTGQFRTAHKSALQETHDVIYRNGQAWYFRDRADVWQWEGVEYEIRFPKTLYVKAITAEGAEPKKLDAAGLKKLEELSKGFSPVIAQGFAN